MNYIYFNDIINKKRCHFVVKRESFTIYYIFINNEMNHDDALLLGYATELNSAMPIGQCDIPLGHANRLTMGRRLQSNCFIELGKVTLF